jgi:hypothetical protein
MLETRRALWSRGVFDLTTLVAALAGDDGVRAAAAGEPVVSVAAALRGCGVLTTRAVCVVAVLVAIICWRGSEDVITEGGPLTLREPQQLTFITRSNTC